MLLCSRAVRVNRANVESTEFAECYSSLEMLRKLFCVCENAMPQVEMSK